MQRQETVLGEQSNLPKYEGCRLAIYLPGSGMVLNLADRVFVDMRASGLW